MRTKTLLCAAALAAGVATSMAQSNVYSLNVVGYVNVKLFGGGQYNMIANPLNNTNNNITNLFTQAGDGDTIFRWDVASYDFAGIQPTYSLGTHSWSSPFVLKPGEGIWYINANNDYTNTFVGEVVQGPYTNNLFGGGQYNAVASSAPIGGSFTNAIVGFAPGDGDTIFPWDVTTYDFSGTQPAYSLGTHSWSHTEVPIAPGAGFIYINANSDIVWVRNFTVQ